MRTRKNWGVPEVCLDLARTLPGPCLGNVPAFPCPDRGQPQGTQLSPRPPLGPIMENNGFCYKARLAVLFAVGPITLEHAAVWPLEHTSQQQVSSSPSSPSSPSSFIQRKDLSISLFLKHRTGGLRDPPATKELEGTLKTCWVRAPIRTQSPDWHARCSRVGACPAKYLSMRFTLARGPPAFAVRGLVAPLRRYRHRLTNSQNRSRDLQVRPCALGRCLVFWPQLGPEP